MPEAIPNPTTRTRRWRASSLALIVSFWAVLQIGGLFTPGLLDDVDSVYIQIAREMLQRHDFVTPTIDGIRFFDKPPLLYWMAAGSMHLLGIHDWAARLPLALGVLALLLATYALGIRFYGSPTTTTRPSPSAQDLSPCAQQDRAGLYAALAMATCIGPYLYTRFYIPDILIALWMTLAVHFFLIAVDRANASLTSSKLSPSAQDPMLGFAAVTALNLLTKGLIGVVFPLAFVLLYLIITRQLRLLRKLHLIPSTLVFLAIAAPWHILAAIRNPPVPMPRGLGLPAHAGWAWFYLYNEHIARFLGRRIPHDYGQVPIPIFWALLLLWLFPWVAFLPSALLDAYRTLRTRRTSSPKHIPPSPSARDFDSDADFLASESNLSSIHNVISTERAPLRRSGEIPAFRPHQHPSPIEATRSPSPSAKDREAAIACLLWAGIILGFFTLSSRQEYYHLPALPALALLVGGFLAAADRRHANFLQQAGRAALYFLVPLGSLLFVLCGYLALTAPTPAPGLTLSEALRSNPNLYTLSLGHLFDLTGPAMGFFRGPLLTTSLGMLALGPIAWLVRRRSAFAGNLVLAAAMTAILLAAHEGLVRFYPILGSKDLAIAIDRNLRPGDLILNDGELTSGSALLFYTPQSAAPLLLVNGRVNGPWFGSFYPDAPHIFLDDAQLAHLWAGPHRLFLLTDHPAARTAFLSPDAPVHPYATSGDKTILTNR